MQRRGFLASILAAGFAPAAIGSGILMPVRAIALPFDGQVTGLLVPPHEYGEFEYTFTGPPRVDYGDEFRIFNQHGTPLRVMDCDANDLGRVHPFEVAQMVYRKGRWQLA